VKRDYSNSGRVIEEYIRVINKNTELFSTADPDELLHTLIKFAELSGCSEYVISKDKYKVTLPLFVKKMEARI
jgi:hypothetical protein